MKNPRFKSKRARREADDLVRFIEAHGGRLGEFRCYQTPSQKAARARLLGDAANTGLDPSAVHDEENPCDDVV